MCDLSPSLFTSRINFSPNIFLFDCSIKLFITMLLAGSADTMLSEEQGIANYLQSVD